MIRQSARLDRRSAVRQNLELARKHLRAIVAEPALAERIPNGTTLVLVPDDNPLLAQHNLNLALDAFADGKNVYLCHITEAAGQPAAPPLLGHLTTREAARRLGLTDRRVREFIRTGRLPAAKHGASWLIDEADLELVKDRRPGRPRTGAARRANVEDVTS